MEVIYGLAAPVQHVGCLHVRDMHPLLTGFTQQTSGIDAGERSSGYMQGEKDSEPLLTQMTTSRCIIYKVTAGWFRFTTKPTSRLALALLDLLLLAFMISATVKHSGSGSSNCNRLHAYTSHTSS